VIVRYCGDDPLHRAGDGRSPTARRTRVGVVSASEPVQRGERELELRWRHREVVLGERTGVPRLGAAPLLGVVEVDPDGVAGDQVGGVEVLAGAAAGGEPEGSARAVTRRPLPSASLSSAQRTSALAPSPGGVRRGSCQRVLGEDAVIVAHFYDVESASSM
jgi:hypothetical protein